MQDHITLIGAEQVQNAARHITAAAETMSQAAHSMQETLTFHQRYMDEWMQRFENAMAPPPSLETLTQLCPGCGNKSLEKSPSSGRVWCLFAGSCGWSSE